MESSETAADQVLPVTIIAVNFFRAIDLDFTVQQVNLAIENIEILRYSGAIFLIFY